MGLQRDPAHITWKISIPSVARFVLLSTPCITFKGQLANVPLIKLTATQMARTPNAFSTSPKTPELEVKTLYQVQELISRHRNIWGFQWPYKGFFTAVSRAHAVVPLNNRKYTKFKKCQKQGGLSLIIWRADMTLNEKRTARHRMTNLLSGPQQ